MIVDPSVSRLKFDRDVSEATTQRDYFMRRGAWIVTAEFPEVFVVLGTPKSKPHYVPYGVLFDFTDYDARPLSVRLVDPFTKRRLKKSEIGYTFLRANPLPVGMPVGMPTGFTEILQAFVDDAPFLCLPGIRDYHASSAHSGDSWWLHRRTGEGKLFTLLDKLCMYGAEPITGIQVSQQIVLGNFVGQPPQ
jgi:hypothetical protein